MASGTADPITQPRTWDKVQIGGVESPGTCVVSEFKRAHEFDIKKGKGSLGATITFVGRPPAKGNVKFSLWAQDQFQEWEEFRKLLKYDPTKKAVQAIDIYHPSLKDIDITSVVTESIGNIVPEGKGMYSCTVEFLEYFPPPPASAVSTPSGSKSGGFSANEAGGQSDPVADAQQAEIAALLKAASS